MPILTPHKALRSLRKTPLMLQKILEPITQEEAQTLRDGDDGWSILFVMCHLRDYGDVYFGRIQQTLDEDNPTLGTPPTNDELAEQNHYQDQNLREVFDSYLARRQEYIALLESLTDEQWARVGSHPRTGTDTLLIHAINSSLHDVDHIGQILQILGDKS